MDNIGEIYYELGIPVGLIIDIDRPQAFQPPVLHVFMFATGSVVEIHPLERG